MLRVRLRTPPPLQTSSTSTLTGSSPGPLPPPTYRHCSPNHSRSAMCSRVCGDFGRDTIQIAPTPTVASTSADTTVSTRRGIHHGCGTSPASTRRITPRRKVSNHGPVHTASPHARMRLRYPAREGIKPEAGEAKPHNPPTKRSLRDKPLAASMKSPNRSSPVMLTCSSTFGSAMAFLASEAKSCAREGEGGELVLGKPSPRVERPVALPPQGDLAVVNKDPGGAREHEERVQVVDGEVVDVRGVRPERSRLPSAL